MQFTISTKELKRVMELASKVVAGKKATQPILRNVIMESESTQNGRIVVRATDWELTLWAIAQASVKKTGRILVSYDDVAKLGKSHVTEFTFSTGQGKDNNQILAQGKTPSGIVKSKYLESVDPEEYPELQDPVVLGTKYSQFAGGGSAHHLKVTMRYMAQEKMRYALNGFNLVHRKKEIDITATDGKRLYTVTLPATRTLKKISSCIVPGRIADFKKYLTDDTAFYKNPKLERVDVAFGSFYLSMRTLEGQYPDYKAVVNRPKKNRVELSTLTGKEPLAMIKDMDMPEGSETIKLSILNPGTLTIATTGENPDMLEIPAQGNLDIVTGYTRRYFLDFLEDSPESLMVDTPCDPARFDFPGGGIGILMPVNLSDDNEMPGTKTKPVPKAKPAPKKTAKKTARKCEKCGSTKNYHARGMCKTCYRANKKKGA